jgi:hypothetical protein
VRILIDESLPWELAEELGSPEVTTVSEAGWSGLSNGALLRRAEAAGFGVLLTADQNLPYQQNVPASGIAVIVLKARRNRIEDLRPLIPGIRQTLQLISPGQVVRLGGG